MTFSFCYGILFSTYGSDRKFICKAKRFHLKEQVYINKSIKSVVEVVDRVKVLKVVHECLKFRK